MCASRLIGLVAVLLLGFAASASAADPTGISAFLVTLLAGAQSWLYAITGIGFVAALAGKAVEHFYSVSALVGVPIYYVVLGGLGAAVLTVFLAGLGLAAGATLS